MLCESANVDRNGDDFDWNDIDIEHLDVHLEQGNPGKKEKSGDNRWWFGNKCDGLKAKILCTSPCVSIRVLLRLSVF